MEKLIRRCTAAALAAGATLALTALVAESQGRAEGYAVTQRVTGDGAQENTTLRIKVSQGRVRVEIDGAQQGMPPGSFVLLRDDGKVNVVLPSQGMALAIDAQQMQGGMQMMRAFGMEPPVVSGVSVDVTDLGAGESILGFPTRKYRVRQQYTITSSTRGQARTERHDDVSEFWMTTAMPGFTDGLEKFAETLGSTFGGAGQGASRELAAAMAGKIPRGYPLKSIVKSNATGAGGQVTTSTTTLEVLDVSKVTLDASEFEVPAGIQVIDPAQMMRGRGSGI